MAQVTKNAFKGYTYQAYVYLLFLCIMDTTKDILWIDAEVGKNGKTHDFDDIQLNINDEEYFVQMKNYADFSESDFEVTPLTVIVNGVKSTMKKNFKNIIMLSNCNLKTDSQILGLPATLINNLYIVPLSPDDICDNVDRMYKKDMKRNIQICHFTFKRIVEEAFYTKKEELPPYVLFNQKLHEQTILVREKFDELKNGVLYIVGKPGVGKSHFVNEFSNLLPNSEVYRFWINSQDDCQNDRLQYDNFIRDISYRVFKSAGFYSEDDLIDAITDKNIVLIIDGLDHVENYNHIQLEKFFDLISKLSKTRTIILTRPLKHEIGTNVFILDNWDYNQTYKYLEQCHKITNNYECQEIFRITDGYPILVNYSANHYKLYGKLESTEKIYDVNKYYSLLINEVDTISAISIFNTTNSYLSRQDIVLIAGHPMLEKIVFEFITAYPYLFEKSLNRFTLIHDSFNTYLRNINLVEDTIMETFILNIEQSLRNNELRFMNRINNINISDSIKLKLLFENCNFNTFEQLLKNNWDIEAIKEFYAQLYDFLSKQPPDIFNIYQYYTFILIIECCNRIHLDWNINLLYQHVMYMYYYKNNEIANIYSNKSLFKICNYFFIENTDLTTFEMNQIKDFYNCYVEDNISSDEISRFIDAHKNNEEYVQKHSKPFKYKNIIENQLDRNITELDFNDVISNIIANLIIHGKDYNEFAKNFLLFIKDNNKLAMRKFEIFYEKQGTRKRFVKSMLDRAKYILFSLGFLKDINPYINESLFEIISQEAFISPDNASSSAENYIRLAIIINKEIDISSVYKCYVMFYSEKDYSVISLPTALINFEKHKIITSVNSLKVLQGIINQSSRGLSHLIEDYVNEKGVNEFINLKNNGLFSEDYRFSVFRFEPQIINMIPEDLIAKELFEYFYAHHYGKLLEIQYMQNVLDSNHAELVKYLVEKYEYKIVDASTKISASGNRKKYTECGYLIDEDKKEIIETGVDHLTISAFKDGRYHCFNNLDFYKHYDKQILREDLCKIIHISMNSKIKTLDLYGEVRYYLGNIPAFTNMIDYDLDWHQLYSILTQFLMASLINPYIELLIKNE